MKSPTRRTPSDSAPWFFLPPDPPCSAAFRRSGIFIIAVLAFLTLGLLVASFIHSTAPALATHNSRQPVKHRPEIRHPL